MTVAMAATMALSEISAAPTGKGCCGPPFALASTATSATVAATEIVDATDSHSHQHCASRLERACSRAKEPGEREGSDGAAFPELRSATL